MSRTALLSALLIWGCSGATNDTSDEPVWVEGESCDSIPVYESPSDPSARGPWPVGVRTVRVGRLDVEVLYPAVPGSESGLDPLEVDIRYALPESEREKVGDDVRPHQTCDCYAELPVDETHGPYPLILFVHGTASWRTQSLSLMEHWASRGFVVAAADHPGLWLSDILGSVCGLPATGSQDLGGDLETVLTAFTEGDAALDFVSGRTDIDRVAVVGHSAGGGAATAAADLPGVRIVIPMGGGGSTDAANLDMALYLGGIDDTVVSFSQIRAAYEQSDVPRRLVGIDGGAHLIFSDICELTNDAGRDLVEIATEAGVCGTQFASFLFDCAASRIPAADARAIVQSTTTWELENRLHCEESLDPFEEFSGRSDWVDVFESAGLDSNPDR